MREMDPRHGVLLFALNAALLVGCVPASRDVQPPSARPVEPAPTSTARPPGAPPQPAGTPPQPGGATPQPADAPQPPPTPRAATPIGPTATPVPTVVYEAPVADRAVPELGTLVLAAQDGHLYRYDGAAGSIEKLTSLSAWRVLRQTRDGAYFTGLHGGVLFVPWHGQPAVVPCGRGLFVDISSGRACASLGFGPDGGVFVKYAEEVVARRILAPDWRAEGLAWHPDSRRLALLRLTRDAAGYQIRGHNTLWMLEPDGRLRRVYEPCCGSMQVAGLQWSTDGRTLAVSLSSGCAGCDHRDGNALKLVDPVSGRVTDLGTTTGSAAWSSAGSLAFVQGTPEHSAAAVLSVRAADGTVRPIESGARAPAWDAAGRQLAWADARGNARILEVASGRSQTIACPDRQVEGVRFSTDGSGLLLLCRREDPTYDRFELWFAKDGNAVRLVTGVGGRFRSSAPDPFDFVAWSNGAAR